MRVTNGSFRLANAALLSAVTLALFGCGSDSLSEGVQTSGDNEGDQIVVSVTPDYKLDLTAPVDFGGTLTEETAINPDIAAFASGAAPLSSRPMGTVLKTTKPAGAEVWAGTTLSDTKALDLSEELSQITIWVYSPEAGIPVLLKVENVNNSANSAEFAQVLVNTTQANQWEMLTFDFTNLNDGELNPEFIYNKKSIFFDFNNQGSGKVFYWDNVRHEGKGLLEQPQPESFPVSDSGEPLLGNPNYQAISYGAWRTKERMSGETVPSIADQMEDMKVLNAMGIKMIRTYNTQGFIGLDDESNTENLLAAIHQLKTEDPDFEMYVMLGVWISAFNSGVDGATMDSGTDSPDNVLELTKAKELALEYPDIVKVIAVGNEAMVDWAEAYKVHPSIILNHVNELQSWKLESDDTKDIWVTTSDNWAVWAGQDANGNLNEQQDLKALIQAVDYVSLHTYAHHDTHYHPTFSEEWKVPESDQDLTKEEQISTSMDKAFVHSLEQYAAAQQFVHAVDPSKPIHIGETGWSTVSTDLYGEGGTQAADEYKQKLFHDDMRDFSQDEGVSLFFFQAFDEPWKGDASNDGHSEQHFGLIDIDCNIKYLAWDKVDTLNELGLTRDCAFTASYGGNLEALVADILPPPFVTEEKPVVGDELDYIFSASELSPFSFLYWGDTWGSGATFEVLETDSSYDKVIELVSGNVWGADVGAIAWGNEDIADAVDTSNYSHIRFQVKSDGFDSVKVSMQSFEGAGETHEPIYSITTDGTLLDNGWYQIDATLPTSTKLQWIGLVFETSSGSSSTVRISDISLVLK
ncbi:hypothetical protein [Vibrio sp. 10N.261.51.F12]|uniref:hypothetical protein n=1 Tax=Vibrio sp. 10N.261.51.F12 TaxID=3229679 RepID=UPI00354FB438